MLVLHTYKLVSDQEFLSFYQREKSRFPSSLVEKIDAFKFPIDQQRSLMGQLIVRQFYADALGLRWQNIEFEYNQHDKPSLKLFKHQYFNISHSGNRVIVAFSDQEVGLDVEKIKGDRRRIADRFFTDSELKDLKSITEDHQQQLYFYQLWTLKESYMKAIGKGISMSLDSFAFTKELGKFKLAYSQHDADWSFYSTYYEDGYFLSLCAKEDFSGESLEIFFENISVNLISYFPK